MVKINKHIEIVRSSVGSLSSMSQRSHDSIYAILSEHYTTVGTTIVNNAADLKAVATIKPDLVFLGMKFAPSDPSLGLEDSPKIWVTSYLDKQGIAYTGSQQAAHELELDKSLAKQRALDAGLDTSPFLVIVPAKLPVQNHILLKYPMFVKPIGRGGGLGIDAKSVAYNYVQLRSKVHSIAAEFQSDSLVEEYLPGREFSVAILKDEHSLEFSVMPIELIAPLNNDGLRILSDQVKSSDTEQFIAVTDPVIRSKINDLALNVFYALGARDYGRIDIRLDKDGTPQFLEANLIPSLLRGFGNFPKACMLNLGLDYESVILSIVRLALARSLSLSDIVPELNNPIPAFPALLPSLEPV